MIVVGSGPAGLTAAYLLAKRGLPVTVVDRAHDPGGLWRGITYGASGPHFELGMHWYTDCGVPEIDEFWWNLPTPKHDIEREIAGCWFNGKLQTNSPYPDVRAGGGFSRYQVMRKIWGVDPEGLAEHAKDLVKIDRVVGFDEESTLKGYADPKFRERYAWPEQRTMPEQFRSNRRSFYPRGGMRALVELAVAQLAGMGVVFRMDSSLDLAAGLPMIWAAGLHGAAQLFGIHWGCDTPPRRFVVVNALRYAHAGDDLHYAFNYEPDSLFRVTWYSGFTNDLDRRISFEYIGDLHDTMAPHRDENISVFGVHDLGPVLPVPTKANEIALEHVRAELALAGVKVIGSGANAGMFYQPDVLRHVADVCG